MFNKSCNRREFLKWSGMLIGGLPVVSKLISPLVFAQSTAKSAAKVGAEKDTPGLTLVADNDPVAKTLLYTHIADNAPADKRVDKMGTPAKSQICANCNFYVKKGSLGGQEVGQCQLIQAGVVKSKGWCISWFKKA
jgi:hypothetical protein